LAHQGLEEWPTQSAHGWLFRNPFFIDAALGAVHQNHLKGGVACLFQAQSSGKRHYPTDGVADQLHRLLNHVQHETLHLLGPEVHAVPHRFGVAFLPQQYGARLAARPKADQIKGEAGPPLRQQWQIVTPMFLAGSEAMHEYQGTAGFYTMG
jgi:hypothetical protein